MDLRKRTPVNYGNIVNRPDFYYKPYAKKLITNIPITKLQAINFKEEIENLKGVIFKCLKSSTAKSPTMIKKVEISKKFSNFLKKKYVLNRNWSNGNSFLSEFNFKTDRDFNEYDYCALLENSFKIKVIAGRKVKFGKSTSKHFQLKSKLSMLFTVTSRKRLM